MLFTQVDILGTRAFFRGLAVGISPSLSPPPSIISPGAPSLPSLFPMESVSWLFTQFSSDLAWGRRRGGG